MKHASQLEQWNFKQAQSQPTTIQSQRIQNESHFGRSPKHSNNPTIPSKQISFLIFTHYIDE